MANQQNIVLDPGGTWRLPWVNTDISLFFVHRAEIPYFFCGSSRLVSIKMMKHGHWWYHPIRQETFTLQMTRPRESFWVSSSLWVRDVDPISFFLGLTQWIIYIIYIQVPWHHGPPVCCLIHLFHFSRFLTPEHWHFVCQPRQPHTLFDWVKVTSPCW